MQGILALKREKKVSTVVLKWAFKIKVNSLHETEKELGNAKTKANNLV